MIRTEMKRRLDWHVHRIHEFARKVALASGEHPNVIDDAYRLLQAVHAANELRTLIDSELEKK